MTATSPAATTAPLAKAALGAIVVIAGTLAAGAASHPQGLVPDRSATFPRWMRGPLEQLGIPMNRSAFVVGLLVICLCYLGVLLLRDSISARAAISTIVAANLVMVLAPPLFSGDVFGYIDYARLGAVHGLNPYSHAPQAFASDAVYPHVGWRHDVSPYGPLFTLGSYAIAQLGVTAMFWIFKVLVFAASLSCVALVWTCARKLGRPPIFAALFLGLNPVLLVYALPAAHNDFVAMAFALTAIYLVLAGRDAGAGAFALMGLATKASVGLLLPFVLIGSRRRMVALGGALACGILVAVAAWIWFGSHSLGFFDSLRVQQHTGAVHSVPLTIARLFGSDTATTTLRIVCGSAFAVAFTVALWSVRRGENWIDGAAWATFALLVTTLWLVPWYLVWLLPLAALSASRKLIGAALCLSAFVIALSIPVWLG